MENITAKLFGMEMLFFQRCKESEKKHFRAVAILFIALIVACVLAFNYFFYLLLQSHVLAFLLSLILGFVYYSILRFSIITIGIPLSEVITIKRVILNSGNIFRALIFSMFVFTITVPLVAFVYRKELNPKIDEIKSELVKEYRIFKTNSADHQLNSIDERIEEKRIEIAQLKNDKSDERIIQFKIQKISNSIVILENIRIVNNKDPITLFPISTLYYHVDNFIYLMNNGEKEYTKDMNMFLRILYLPFQLYYRNLFLHHKCDLYIERLLKLSNWDIIINGI